ncbi:MAG: TatD family hydrolase [Nanoarchaeota archaeon]|nr:TatD family hydrolase [Nanoarchaeota archaeon]
MLVDVHAHVTSEQFAVDRDAMLARHKDMLIIENGLNPENNLEVLALAKKYPQVKASLGIYPKHTVEFSPAQFDEQLKFMEKQKDHIVAIGEIGLDLQELPSLDIQQERFIQQVKLAQKLHKPVIVHSRKAEKETVETLASIGYKKVVMHCFCGNMKLVKMVEDFGWSITIPALVVTSSHFKAVADRVSINQLLTETDSPYLNPVKNERNEPRNVLLAIKKIAEIKKLDVDEVEKNVFMNAQRLFLVQ